MDGPPSTWTPGDIKGFIADRFGMQEIPGAELRAYEEIERQFEAGEKFGFYADRVHHIAELQEKYENGCWEFRKYVPTRCYALCSGRETACITVYRKSNGEYQTVQCGYVREFWKGDKR